VVAYYAIVLGALAILLVWTVLAEAWITAALESLALLVAVCEAAIYGPRAWKAARGRGHHDRP
jgi:hypothetical protein